MVDIVARLYQQGQYMAASRAFLEALQDPQIISPGQLADLYYLGARIRYKLQQHHSALELLRMAERYAVSAGNANLLGRIWFNLVDYLRICGETGEALEYAGRFIENMGMYPELEQFAGACHYNMGLCLDQRRQYPEAISHYRVAEALIAQAGDVATAVMVLQNLAWLLIQEGELSEADGALTRAAEKLAGLDARPDLQRNLLLVQGYRRYAGREYEEARLVCMEFLSPGVQATAEQRFWSCWMLGMMYAEVGRPDLTERFWALANDAALVTGEPRLLNSANDLRRRLLLGAVYPSNGEQ